MENYILFFSFSIPPMIRGYFYIQLFAMRVCIIHLKPKNLCLLPFKGWGGYFTTLSVARRQL